MKSLVAKTGLCIVIVWAWLAPSCSIRKAPAFAPSLEEAEAFVASGEYGHAIEAYQAAAKTFPGERAILADYVKAIEEMGNRAERALAAGDYTTAEGLFALLLTNYPRFKELQLSLSFAQPWLSRKIRESRFERAEVEARQALETGNFQKALEGYRNFAASDFAETSQADAFSKIVDEIRQQADSAVAADDFIRAGNAYAALLESYPRLEELRLSPASLLSELQDRLDSCRTILTRKGLEEYRKGNLDRAIAHWEGLLEFDPDNVEIRKAVETATDQQKKLRKKK